MRAAALPPVSNQKVPMLRALPCGLVLTAGTLLAQTPPCFSANDSNLNVPGLIYGYSSANVGKHGWQVSPATPVVAQGLQVVTGNNYSASIGAFMSLEIWDDVGGLPNARLAGGTWRLQAATSWQGANLDQPVVLLPGTPYWIVFVEPGWSVPPYEPGAAATFPTVNLSGSSWVPGTASGLKFRLFCGPLDGPGVVAFGQPCADSTGAFGTAFTNQTPSVGNTTFAVEGTGLLPGTAVLEVIGVTQGFPSVPIPGTNACFLSTDWLLSIGATTGTGTVRSGCSGCASAEASGHVTFTIPIAASPALAGFYFAPQLVSLDYLSALPLPFVSSNALQITIQ